MTVCIAALCEGKGRIVTIADSKASYGDYSADNLMFKADRLGENWYALFSGDDITGVSFVLEAAKAKVSALVSPAASQIADAVHEALIERLHRQIEAKVLAKYGWTLEKFLQDGKILLTEKVFDDLCDQILTVRLPFQILVVGFDGENDGHIFVVDGDNAPASLDPVGFGAIGSGYSAATSALLFRADHHNLSIYSPVADCVYCCCEAKFMAESATDVGRATFLAIFEYGKSPAFIAPHRIEEEIRKPWERYGAPRMHPPLINKLPGMIFSWIDSEPHPMQVFMGPNRPRRNTNYSEEFKAIRRSFDLSSLTKKRYRPSTKVDSSPQQPSPESPGGSDES